MFGLKKKTNKRLVREAFRKIVKKREVLEKLAELEHDQWVKWSTDIASKEKLSPGRMARWRELWIPYEQLTKEMKEFDREWARKVLEIVRGDKI